MEIEHEEAFTVHQREKIKRYIDFMLDDMRQGEFLREREALLTVRLDDEGDPVFTWITA